MLTRRRVHVSVYVGSCTYVRVSDAWLVNTIYHESNHGYFSYHVYRIPQLRETSLLFLVDVKEHIWSPEVINRKHFKRDISK